MGIFMDQALPTIPAKRYFTIGEVSDLCGVKPYVLRYWEQEFTQLKPMKRRGNRRYYQHHEVLLIRRIRELLYDLGFTINGARNRLADHGALRFAGLSGLEAEEASAEAQVADRGDEAPEEEDDGQPAIGNEILVRAMRAEAAAHAPLTVSANVATAAVPARKRPSTSAAPDAAPRSLREELLSIRDLLQC
jgi:DNA-binding transcriptional MerR regulator